MIIWILEDPFSAQSISGEFVFNGIHGRQQLGDSPTDVGVKLDAIPVTSWETSHVDFPQFYSLFLLDETK